MPRPRNGTDVTGLGAHVGVRGPTGRHRVFNATGPPTVDGQAGFEDLFRLDTCTPRTARPRRGGLEDEQRPELEAGGFALAGARVDTVSFAFGAASAVRQLFWNVWWKQGAPGRFVPVPQFCEFVGGHVVLRTVRPGSLPPRASGERDLGCGPVIAPLVTCRGETSRWHGVQVRGEVASGAVAHRVRTHRLHELAAGVDDGQPQSGHGEHGGQRRQGHRTVPALGPGHGRPGHTRLVRHLPLAQPGHPPGPADRADPVPSPDLAHGPDSGSGS